MPCPLQQHIDHSQRIFPCELHDNELELFLPMHPGGETLQFILGSVGRVVSEDLGRLPELSVDSGPLTKSCRAFPYHISGAKLVSSFQTTAAPRCCPHGACQEVLSGCLGSLLLSVHASTVFPYFGVPACLQQIDFFFFISKGQAASSQTGRDGHGPSE